MKESIFLLFLIILLSLMFTVHEIKQDKILFPIDADTGE